MIAFKFVPSERESAKRRYVWASLIVLGLSSLLTTSTVFAEEGANPECVILLHGMWRRTSSLRLIESELVNKNYRVINVGYPSLSHSIEELSAFAIGEGLRRCRAHGPSQINFVTHSLGGILVRQYLSEHNIPNLHRVVMLSPPNQGSQLADQLLAVAGIESILPAAAKQLGTGEQSVPRNLGPVDFELGIIAGSDDQRPFLPGAPRGPNDGTISVEETKVAGMTDLFEVHANHTFIMKDREVVRQIIHFLMHGEFAESTEADGTTERGAR